MGWLLPKSLNGFLLLGLGFTTFVLSFAVWALAGISLAADSVILGVVVGAAFGLALGGGCEVLLHCREVVAHADVRRVYLGERFSM